MTRERAIEVLKAWDLNWSDDFTANEFEQAFAMAISALSENKGDMVSRGVVEQIMWERDVAIEQLKDLGYCLGEKTRENKGEWIPVSERLPDNNVRVLCSAISTSISGGYARFVGCCNNGFWFVQTDAETISYPRQYEVIAWQPLPEPYKGESEEV